MSLTQIRSSQALAQPVSSALDTSLDNIFTVNLRNVHLQTRFLQAQSDVDIATQDGKP